MHRSLLNNKTLTAFLLTLALITTAAAATIQNADNKVVWLNAAEDKTEFTVKCQDNYEFRNATIAVDGSNHTLSEDAEISNSEFPTGLSAGETVFWTHCTNSTGSFNHSITSGEVDIKSFNIKGVEKPGKGFIGDRLDSNGIKMFIGGEAAYSNTEPVEVSFSVEGLSAEKVVSGWGKNRFRIESGQLSVQSVKLSKSGDRVNAKIVANVNGVVSSPVELQVLDGEGNVIKSREIEPKIYRWSASLAGAGNPGRWMTYEQVRQGGYSYNLEVKRLGENPGKKNILGDSNFKLTVLKKDSSESYSSWTRYESINKENWLDVSKPVGKGNYRVKLSNEGLKKLDQKLGNSEYMFVLWMGHRHMFSDLFSSDEREGTFIVDKVVVDKGSMFSGVVTDSNGRGVKSVMEFISDNSNMVIASQSDGFYSKELESYGSGGDSGSGSDTLSFKSATLKFFDRGKASPDSVVNLKNPVIGKNSDLGPGGTAIRYDYIGKPKVNIEGVDVSALMAAKFGYSISSVSSARMQFNPAEVNPEKVQAYECNKWNFNSKECLGEWERIGDDGSESVSVNFATWEVVMKGLDSYETPDGKKILMNAYAIGTNANLQLDGAISVSGPSNGRIPKGSKVTITGRVKSEKGNYIQGVPVEVTFSSPDYDKTLNATTNIDGKFTATGSAPEDPGEYSITVKAEPERYNGFERKFENELVTFTKKDISVKVPRNPEVTEAQETTLDVKVENSGQEPVEDVTVSVSGFNEKFYSLDPKSLGSIAPGKSKTVRLTVDLPMSYYNGGQFPSFSVKASGVSGEEELKASGRTTLIVNQASSTGNQSSGESQTSEKKESSQQNETGSIMPSSLPGEGAINATGEFIASQSTVNLALGIIMLFMMVVAAAVKKNDSGSSRGRRGRPVAGGGGSAGGMGAVKVSGSEEEVEEAEDLGQFDTEEARELYEEMKEADEE